MFIREVKKQRNNNTKAFYQYNLVQTSRVDGKVSQKIILYLGSDPELQDKKARGMVLEVLKSLIFKQPNLFPEDIPKNLKKIAEGYYEKYLIRYELDESGNSEKQTDSVSIPPLPERADMHHVNLNGLEVSDVKSFGTENLCKQVLEKLELEGFLKSLGFDNITVKKLLIAITSRAIFSASEHKTAQILSLNSALYECFSFKGLLSHKQLYTASDQLYQHKSKIDDFLYKRTTSLFNIDDKLVIYDISNTYFETGKRKSKLAKYGRSKEKRADCPLVVFTGVINAAGFIRHSRIYEGNRPDSTTLEDMLLDLESHTNTTSKKTIVMDAGIATDENLALIKEKGYDYVCVSRKRLSDYPVSTDPVIELTDRGHQKVALSIFHQEGSTDTLMYVQSDAKRQKEQSIDAKLSQRFELELATIAEALTKKGGTKKIEKVWERIGRAKERNKKVAAHYEVFVKDKEGVATELNYKTKTKSPAKEHKENGVYFIRTSYKDTSEKELWQIYNTIREVESTFRCLKSDLQIRPVHHQKDERIEAHLYLTLLAYQLVNTIRHMLKSQGLNYDWKNIVRIMSTQTIQTVELPTDKKHIHLRKPAKPIREALEIYKAAYCKETQKAIKKYVVYH
jgi:hypothetical protein